MYSNIILIPYRNRKSHLDYFLEHSWKLIKDNLPNSKLVIIEQEEGKLFNRGKVLNVGFKEYLDKTEYFITHDVDVNPLESVLHLYKLEPTNDEIIGIYTSPYITLGGIIKLSNTSINVLNGFPNNYWGWGVEDKVLYNRAIYFNKNIKFNILSRSKDVEKFFKVFNDVNDRHKDNTIHTRTQFEYDIFKKLSKEKQLNHITSSGLNNLEYTILERRNIDTDIEIIKVSI
jgi:hypothetical protein